MFCGNSLTICQSCGRQVHMAPQFCALCGSPLGPIFLTAPGVVSGLVPSGTRDAARSAAARGREGVRGLLDIKINSFEIVSVCLLHSDGTPLTY